jgi:hypothetical protein
VNKNIKKKRRKKYKKLWNSTISLREYNGRIDIDKNYVVERRKARYEFEEYLFNHLGYIYVTKEIDPIIKGKDKICNSEPPEP